MKYLRCVVPAFAFAGSLWGCAHLSNPSADGTVKIIESTSYSCRLSDVSREEERQMRVVFSKGFSVIEYMNGRFEVIALSNANLSDYLEATGLKIVGKED